MASDRAGQLQVLLAFWFTELRPAQWWKADPAQDAAMRARFGALHAQAAAGELWAWRTTASGRLGELLLLDQLSRNIHRGRPQAFACDPMALALAQEAVAGGHDAALPPAQRAFVYMPYMHSESLRIHEEALRLFAQPGLEDNLRSERRHLAILQRFGRYPHRNAVLGRASTAEELEFLRQPGPGF